MNKDIGLDDIRENFLGVKKKFMVFSGKSGVGKTTVSVNLAYLLTLRGHDVGLLDIDIHGPNIVKSLGLEQSKLVFQNEKLEPIIFQKKLKVMSAALLLENEESPIIWRGPLKMKLIKEFLGNVHWGNLDFMIIDAPPGTGDEPLSIAELIKDMDGAIIITTPQKMSTGDAKKSISFAKQLKFPFIGVIENMTAFLCPHCEGEIDLFGSGGGKRISDEMDVVFMGSIPYEIELMQSMDEGVLYFNDPNLQSPAKKAYTEIIEKILEI